MVGVSDMALVVAGSGGGAGHNESGTAMGWYRCVGSTRPRHMGV